jgi:hypothetical protein
MNEMAASRKKVIKAYDLRGIMQTGYAFLFETNLNQISLAFEI